MRRLQIRRYPDGFWTGSARFACSGARRLEFRSARSGGMQGAGMAPAVAPIPTAIAWLAPCLQIDVSSWRKIADLRLWPSLSNRCVPLLTVAR